MDREMKGSADRRSRQEKDQKPQRTEPSRNRRAKSEQPDGVETQMHEAAVDERIGRERPDRGTPADRPRVLPQYSQVIARGNKGEQIQESIRLLGAEQKLGHHMDEAHDGQERQHDNRDIEDAFAGWLHEVVPGESGEIGCAVPGGKPTKTPIHVYAY